MKKNFNHLSVIGMAAATIISLSSCFPTGITSDPYIIDKSRQQENFYYVPSAPNTPFQTKKGDVSFNLMRTTGTKYNGTELQASYLAGKKIGIIGSYSSAGNGNSPMYVKYHRFELGSGFVMQLPKNWHFETYGGLGFGQIENSHATGFSKISLSHIFIQPAIVVSDEKKNIQFGFVSKFSGVDFKVTDTAFNTDREPYSTMQLKSLYDQPLHIVWEPGFIFRAGWKNFQFHTGYSFSTDLTNSALYKPNSNISIGLCLRINGENK